MQYSIFLDREKLREAQAGVLRILPLCLAVIPWGILAGSMAVHTGLSVIQAMLMSLMIFAGAAQLLSLGLLGVGTSSLTILISIFFITAQHYLYALTLRRHVRKQDLKTRLMIGFLLTDELFAVCMGRTEKLSKVFILSAGITFYLAWNLSSFCGIALASFIPNLSSLHLDFSIVATFIAIIVPLICKIASFIGVLTSIILSIVLSMLHVQGSIVIAGLVGMLTATLWESYS